MRITLIAALIAVTLGTVVSIPQATHEALVNHTTTVQRAYWDGQQFQPVIATVVQYEWSQQPLSGAAEKRPPEGQH